MEWLTALMSSGGGDMFKSRVGAPRYTQQQGQSADQQQVAPVGTDLAGQIAALFGLNQSAPVPPSPLAGNSSGSSSSSSYGQTPVTRRI